ncbi:MAG: metallophosphoesterase [Clostridia bacterium]|nr:metallophosphoesterase [Clostridia bacterium]
MKTTVASPYIDPRRRILVTSDIHGHAAWLKNALTAADFGGDDLLIVVGDLVEKGPESLETIRTVMSLCREGRALATVGNVDKWRLHFYRTMAANADEKLASELYDYTLMSRDWWGGSFYEEMAAESGCSVDSPAEILATCKQVLNDHKAELDFLDSLPAILTAGKYIFVHGGLPSVNLDDAREADVFSLLKRDWYLREVREKNLCFDSYVLVGHFPTALYDERIFCLNPIIDKEHHVICLDGGCGIKTEGQLNLLILPGIDSDGSEATWIARDDLPAMRALDDQAENADPFNIHWGDCAVRALGSEGDCTLVEHIRTGRRLWAPTEYLYANGTQCNDITDYRLPVSAGDSLSLIRSTDRGHIVKKDGVVGWYLGRMESATEND